MEAVEWSCPQSEREGTPLLLMLHGYGSSEKRMSSLFDAMPKGFTCAAPRASREISEDFGWFLLDYFLDNDFSEVVAAASELFAWLDAAMERHKFSSVSVLGFSQGMAMATTLLRLRPEGFIAGVGLSGFVLDNHLLGAMEPLPTRIPFLWAKDPADLVINADATTFTADWLEANTDLRSVSYDGLGHNISFTELRDVASFLTGHVPGSFLADAG